MSQQLLTLNDADKQVISAGSGSIAANEVTIHDATMCRITYPSATLNAGERYQFTFYSNLIVSTTMFFPSIISCVSGFPIFTKIEIVDTGEATIEILNIGAQSSGTQDIDTEDIVFNLMIL